MLDTEEKEPLLSAEQESQFPISDCQPPPLSCDPKILSIFVVAFDTRAGNIVEWNYPESYNLSGVEFKALPSGAHNVQHDVMLFEMHSHFGVAAYVMKQVDSVSERGARMKSVGVICDNFLALLQHEERLVELAQDSVEKPGSYEQLIQYYAEFNESFTSPLMLELRSNAVGTMYDLFKSQGVHIFSLWKSLLLRRRVLLQCTPPIARHCSYVLCLAALSYSLFTESFPIFYVTVNDVTALSNKHSYIACTADSILATKGSQIYDVYVTGSSVVDHKGDLLPVTRGDIIRYNQLCGAVDRAFGKRNTSEIDKMIQSYFVQMISDIFTTFSTLMSGSRRMEASHLKDIRFHSSDLPFLQTLVDKLGYDVELFQPGCCEESLGHLIGN